MLLHTTLGPLLLSRTEYDVSFFEWSSSSTYTTIFRIWKRIIYSHEQAESGTDLFTLLYACLLCL